MAYMLHGHKDPTDLHIYATAQPTTTSTSYVITNYMPEISMPTKLGIYTIYAK